MSGNVICLHSRDKTQSCQHSQGTAAGWEQAKRTSKGAEKHSRWGKVSAGGEAEKVRALPLGNEAAEGEK